MRRASTVNAASHRRRPIVRTGLTDLGHFRLSPNALSWRPPPHFGRAPLCGAGENDPSRKREGLTCTGRAHPSKLGYTQVANSPFRVKSSGIALLLNCVGPLDVWIPKWQIILFDACYSPLDNDPICQSLFSPGNYPACRTNAETIAETQARVIPGTLAIGLVRPRRDLLISLVQLQRKQVNGERRQPVLAHVVAARDMGRAASTCLAAESASIFRADRPWAGRPRSPACTRHG